MQINRWPEPGSTLRSVKRAGKPLANAPSRLCFCCAFASTEATDRRHHESKSDSDGADIKSDRLFCRSRASVNLNISLERRFARRTVPSESSTMSASPLDSKTAVNAAPSRSCIISERGLEGVLRSAVSTLPVRLAFRRFGISAFTSAPAQSSSRIGALRLWQRHIRGCVEQVGLGAHRHRQGNFGWLACGSQCTAPTMSRKIQLECFQ